MSTVDSMESAMTLADHAEAWWREAGYDIPGKATPEWYAMYEQWINYAFLYGTNRTRCPDSCPDSDAGDVMTRRDCPKTRAPSARKGCQ